MFGCPIERRTRSITPTPSAIPASGQATAAHPDRGAAPWRARRAPNHQPQRGTSHVMPNGEVLPPASVPNQRGFQPRNSPRRRTSVIASVTIVAITRTGPTRVLVMRTATSFRPVRKSLGSLLVHETQLLLHLLAHQVLLDLTGDGHGEAIDELDVARDLVVGDLAFAEAADLLGR